MPIEKQFPGFEITDLRTAGATIHCLHKGSGPPLLLLHGYPQTHVIWHKIANRLSQQYTVVLTDLRGYGDSSKPEGGPRHENYAFRAMAQDQLDVMRQLGFDSFFLGVLPASLSKPVLIRISFGPGGGGPRFVRFQACERSRIYCCLAGAAFELRRLCEAPMAGARGVCLAAGHELNRHRHAREGSPFRTRQTRRANRPWRGLRGWSDRVLPSATRNLLRDAEVLVASKPGLPRTGPSDPSAKPEPHRSHGGVRQRSGLRVVPVAPRRSRPL